MISNLRNLIDFKNHMVILCFILVQLVPFNKIFIGLSKIKFVICNNVSIITKRLKDENKNLAQDGVRGESMERHPLNFTFICRAQI